MSVFLIKLIQLLLSLSILVLLHEGGHFFFSKLFGVRVEKFYLFFDPWFHIFEFKPKNSDTTYGIGWLPLGGYCKIAGMIDESFDTEQMKQPVQPWEFRAKPAWQRLLIMIGGVLVNFLLALFIYSMIMFHWGEDYIPVQEMTYGMKFNQEAKAMGFKDGDILVANEKGQFKDFTGDLFRKISRSKQVIVVRDGQRVTIPLSGDINLLDMLQHQPPFMRPIVPAVIDSVMPQTPAAKAGMSKGDRIVAIGTDSIGSWADYADCLGLIEDQLLTHPEDSTNIRSLKVAFAHTDGTVDTADVTLSADLKMGVFMQNLYSVYKPTHISYSFIDCFPAGIKYGWNTLKGYVSDMQYVFTADGAKSLGGFGTIGSIFPAQWDWYMFWKMTAFLSIILAFMNILPIPALDGGHVLFLLYEMITRRKPSERFMIVAEYIGFGILLLLLIVANLNDVLRWLGVM